jgi:hypothetical protein
MVNIPRKDDPEISAYEKALESGLPKRTAMSKALGVSVNVSSSAKDTTPKKGRR